MRIAFVFSLLLPLFSAAAEPVFPHRILYAPGHFGNSYEVAGVHEMRGLLEEAKAWGFNEYADWFDMIDCADPFATQDTRLGDALWERKKAHFKSAQDLGLRTTLLMTPNHVYADQIAPEVAAKQGDRVFGQLISVTHPDGRATVLANYENLFRDLAEYGVHLNGLNAAPYDYGGDLSDDAQPWILTFAKLCKEIHAIAEEYHPGIEMHFIGWWWSEEEHRLFADWADAEAPGWAQSIALHILYGERDVSDVPLPADCERRAFVHIGYAEDAQPRDVYGHFGPVMAAERIEATVAALRDHGCTGVMAYSEGIYEDANKAILAGLASGDYETADDVLVAYAKKYFDADEATAIRWAAWLRAWGRPFDVNTSQAAGEWQELIATDPTRSWRLHHWQAKLRLVRFRNQAVAAEDGSPERQRAIEGYWQARERLNRHIYGLGPLRHILNARYAPVPGK